MDLGRATRTSQLGANGRSTTQRPGQRDNSIYSTDLRSFSTPHHTTLSLPCALSAPSINLRGRSVRDEMERYLILQTKSAKKLVLLYPRRLPVSSTFWGNQYLFIIVTTKGPLTGKHIGGLKVLKISSGKIPRRYVCFSLPVASIHF